MSYRPSAVALRRFHAALTVAWLVLWAVAAFFGWLHSVTFVSHLSCAALVLASASSWQGARAEERADPDLP